MEIEKSNNALPSLIEQAILPSFPRRVYKYTSVGHGTATPPLTPLSAAGCGLTGSLKGR
jgi:hypothetical protein